MSASTVLGTPIGTLRLAASPLGLTRCGFGAAAWPDHGAPTGSHDRASVVLAQAVRELEDYFAGARRTFTVPVDLRAYPEFERRVHVALRRHVGFGETISYRDLAVLAGFPDTAAQGVGRAMATNPVAIVMPCHRVVGTDGSLTGYAGGIETKRALLELEGSGPPTTDDDQLALPF